jgi:moderate conductance mechanosensitive channel
MRDALFDVLLVYLLPISIAYLCAWLVHRMAGRLATSFWTLDGYVPTQLRIKEERRRTLNQLVASLITFVAFLIATIFALGRFMDATTLIWMIGLFSAAFGLGARPLIADFLTGLSFMFEDTVQVGEKVELMGIQGVIEHINLRTLAIRAQSGELYTVPNGEVRVLRNFSRSQHSSAELTIRLAHSDLPRALTLLQALGSEAATQFPNLVEPWHILNTTGVLAQHVELTLLCKARFGQAADLRLKLLVFLQEKLAEADIQFAA